jgi:hypothetical protein
MYRAAATRPQERFFGLSFSSPHTLRTAAAALFPSQNPGGVRWSWWKERREHVVVVGAFDIKRWYREIVQPFELDFDFGD